MKIDIEKVLTAYIECALWSSTDNADKSGGEPLDANYTPDDISAECLESMRGDVEDFVEANAELLAKSGQSDEQIVHDFWLTRNRHGAGFWDRGLGDIGRQLTEMSHPYGSCDLSFGDDGLIYCN